MAVGFALRLVTDLERSRDRLVTAREEERRRIRRDLHDGLGPQLASAVMALDVATRALGQEPARAAPLVTSAREQLQQAVGDVRRIVNGLRPPALDDLGLLGALQATGPGLLSNARARRMSASRAAVRSTSSPPRLRGPPSGSPRRP